MSDASADHGLDQAIDWLVRTQDASFDDWDAFSDWLAADPAHSMLYDQAMVLTQEGAHRVPENTVSAEPVVVSFGSSRRSGRTFWIPAAVAATIVAGVGGAGYMRSQRGPDLYAVSTLAGGGRDLALDQSVSVTLDGDSNITLDRKNARFARLDKGEALFHVVHDEARPFRLVVGAVTVTDVGTVFDVERMAHATRVAVAEGSVRLAAPGGDVDITAGQGVSVDEEGGKVVRQDVDPAKVGAWKRGRIVFDDLTLADLAERVFRSTGLKCEVRPDVAGRRVSGNIAIGADRTAGMQRLANLLGISITQRGAVWVWSTRAVAAGS